MAMLANATQAQDITLEALRFLTPDQVRRIRQRFGTPVYVYDERTLERQAHTMLTFPNAFGLTVRYSIKACPSGAVLKIFDRLGLQFDASSGWEAMRALAAGIDAAKILLTAQEVPANLRELIAQGVEFNACSLNQLECYGRQFPGTAVSLRLNPGMGSGFTQRTTSGGAHSSFGIWHEAIDAAKALVEKYQLHVKRIHHHIGSGHDPRRWAHIAAVTLALSKRFGPVPVINLGGGYRVRTLRTEPECDYAEIGESLCQTFRHFAAETGNTPHLELEPGTFLVAPAGALVASVTDVVSTGDEGYWFIKVDAGLTEVMRPGFYGAVHPLVSVPAAGEAQATTREYVVVGHCCIAGDVLTPAGGNPEQIAPHVLGATAPGDLLVVERAGGYCSSMNMKNFNSFPEAPEVLRRKDGTFVLIRTRQTLEQMLHNELLPEALGSTPAAQVPECRLPGPRELSKYFLELLT